MTIRTLTADGPKDSGPTQFTTKPWGWERLLIRTERYAAKYLFIAGGQRTSKQRHERKTETLIVVDGMLAVEHAHVYPVRAVAGQVLHIPAGEVHQLCAPTGDVLLFEVSTPQLDDVVRLEDPYGRA
jgi:mannose-6-phosphate isomerase